MERLYGIRNGGDRKSEPNSSVLKKSQSDLAAQMGISVDTLQNYKMLSEMIPELEELLDTGIVTKTIKNLFLLLYTYATIYVGTVGRYDKRGTAMKKLTLEATDENVLESIRNDMMQRSKDVKDFLSMLDTIDNNAFISVDAMWGDGKTFFVRQVEMTMRYYNKVASNKEVTQEEKDAFENNNVLGNLKLEYTYLPIYFNSWLYDNHSNALISLLMVAIKQSEKYINAKIGTDKGDLITTIFDSLQFWKSSNWNNLYKIVQGKNILEDALLLESVRLKVKEIFNDILVEDGQKLVVFVDELDRCRPTFAVEILESIKHYFDDDRIIFVMSINKSQLIHTISKFYGNEFDSSLYLNKFFDVSIQLPKAETGRYFDSCGIMGEQSYYIKMIANDLQKVYSLSLRDTTRYLQKIDAINKKKGELFSGNWMVLIIFIPIVCILDIVNAEDKQDFLSGNGFAIIENLASKSEGMKRYLDKLNLKSDENQDSFSAGMAELKRIYEFGFSGGNVSGWYEGHLEISRDIANECLRICNNV